MKDKMLIVFCEHHGLDPGKPWEQICSEIMAERDAAAFKLDISEKKLIRLASLCRKALTRADQMFRECTDGSYGAISENSRVISNAIKACERITDETKANPLPHCQGR